jgi:hypothetical protein
VIRGECKYFDSCSAPLCPMDSESMSAGIWYADEEVCKRRDLSAPWVKRQKRIAEVTGADFLAGAFNHRMLAHDFTVYKKIQGLDQEASGMTPANVAKWISRHSRRRASSGAEARFRGAGVGVGMSRAAKVDKEAGKA